MNTFLIVWVAVGLAMFFAMDLREMNSGDRWSDAPTRKLGTTMTRLILFFVMAFFGPFVLGAAIAVILRER